MEATLAAVMYLGGVEIVAAGRQLVLGHVGFHIIFRPVENWRHLKDAAGIHTDNIQALAMLGFFLADAGQPHLGL